MFRLHPQLPRCEDCKRWVYDLKTGKRTLRGDGSPVERPPGVGTPCRNCPKIPEGQPPCPESAVELMPENVMCVVHYKQCRATGRWPEDERAVRNAAHIREVEDAIDRAQALAGQGVLAALARAVGGGNG